MTQEKNLGEACLQSSPLESSVFSSGKSSLLRSLLGDKDGDKHEYRVKITEKLAGEWIIQDKHDNYSNDNDSIKYNDGKITLPHT